MSIHWEVNGTVPYESGGKQYRKNLTIHIITDSAERAIELAKDKYSDYIVWSINHRGKVDFIQDKRCLSVTEYLR